MYKVSFEQDWSLYRNKHISKRDGIKALTEMGLYP